MYLTGKENPAASSILIILGLFSIGFFVVGSVIQILVMMAFGASFQEILRNATDFTKLPNAWLSMILGQGLGSFVGIVGTAWLYWRIIEKKQWRDLNFKALPKTQIFFMVILIQVVFMGFNGWLQEINKNIVLPEFMKGFETWLKITEEQAEKATRFFTNFTSFWQFLISFLVMGVIASVGEELVFRGLLVRKLFLGTKNIHVAIWISAFIFAVIHLQFYGILPRMMLGAIFGYLYYWSGNILVPIFGHVFNNGAIVIVMYLYNLGVIKTDPEKMDTAPMSIVLFSLVATIGLLFLFRNYNESQSVESQS